MKHYKILKVLNLIRVLKLILKEKNFPHSNRIFHSKHTGFSYRFLEDFYVISEATGPLESSRSHIHVFKYMNIHTYIYILTCMCTFWVRLCKYARYKKGLHVAGFANKPKDIPIELEKQLRIKNPFLRLSHSK